MEVRSMEGTRNKCQSDTARKLVVNRGIQADIDLAERWRATIHHRQSPSAFVATRTHHGATKEDSQDDFDGVKNMKRDDGPRIGISWSANDDDDDDDDFSYSLPPPAGKRLAPVGGNDADEEKKEDEEQEKKKNMVMEQHNGPKKSSFSYENDDGCSDLENGCDDDILKQRIREMEEEQEELNSSLMSMTSHFAKVQLRLQQVVSAPSDKKEALLKELEHFAFRGIPNLSSPRPQDHIVELKDTKDGDKIAAEDAEEEKMGQGQQDLSQQRVLDAQRKKHTELISQLKEQLEELESYAYESGEAIVPSNLLLERQRVVMEQLKARLNLNTDNLVALSEEELKAEVDSAVGQLVNPLRMKSHLVNQLKTQITDLEMFIQFLQSETSGDMPMDCQGCGCSKHNSPSKDGSTHAVSRSRTRSEQERIRRQTESILHKALTVLQLTAISQFGCGVGSSNGGFHKNTLKQTEKGNHYGDLRARLELAVDHMLDACSHADLPTADEDEDNVFFGKNSFKNSSSNFEENNLSSDLGGHTTLERPELLRSSPLVTAVVRRELAPAIRDLIQHGMVLNSGRRRSLLPSFLSCSAGQRRLAPQSAVGESSTGHAWDVILRYYQLKRGHEFNAAPQRKLSESFGLDLAGSTSHNSNRTSMLAVVGQILASHGQYKRSKDAHFKAFVCAGLNKKKLIPWLKLILRNQTILESYYYPWSYVAKTGFDDALRAIEQLNMYVFELPVDVAVKQFQTMVEAF